MQTMAPDNSGTFGPSTSAPQFHKLFSFSPQLTNEESPGYNFLDLCATSEQFSSFPEITFGFSRPPFLWLSS